MFLWPTPAACRNCLKGELEPARTPCLNGNRFVFYLNENDHQCRVFKADFNKELITPEIVGYNLTFIGEDTIIDLNQNEYKEYYNQIKLKTESKYSVSSERNTSSSYIELPIEQEQCQLNLTKDDNIFYILITIPILYVLTVIIFIIVYCKYRKVRADYERLSVRENSTNNDNSRVSNRQIEL